MPNGLPYLNPANPGIYQYQEQRPNPNAAQYAEMIANLIANQKNGLVQGIGSIGNTVGNLLYQHGQNKQQLLLQQLMQQKKAKAITDLANYRALKDDTEKNRPENIANYINSYSTLFPGKDPFQQNISQLNYADKKKAELAGIDDDKVIADYEQRHKGSLDAMKIGMGGFTPTTKPLIARIIRQDPDYDFQATKLAFQSKLTETKSESAQMTWPKVNADINPKAPGANPVMKTIGGVNLRASRVVGLLSSNAKLTPQQLDTITTDIAGIVQNGVPHLDQVQGQKYTNLQSQWNSLVQRITSDPQQFDNVGVRKVLADTIRSLITADNEVIQGQLKNAEIIYDDVIKRNPQKWNALKQEIMRDNIVNVPAPPGTTPLQGDQAQGMVRIRASDGTIHRVPSLAAAQKIDPGAQQIQ